MQRRFVVRPKARREIADYIAADNLEAADRFLDTVQDAFSQLAAMPAHGERSPLSARELTRASALACPAFCEVPHRLPTQETGVEILRVLHGARNVELLLER